MGFPNAQGQLPPQLLVRSGQISNAFETSSAKKEDPIKNEGARLFATVHIDFSDAQGQITPESVVVSGQNSNSFKFSLMS